MSASERRIEELEAETHRLRHLLSQQMRTGEQLEVEAIVNLDGTPLINLRWDELATQMPVEEGRELALNMLRVCEWAEVDATTLQAMRSEGFDEQTIGGFMALMRTARGGTEESAAVTR